MSSTYPNLESEKLLKTVNKNRVKTRNSIGGKIMEKNVNTTTKALPAPASAAAEARKASCETCGYKNRKQQRPELARLCERREHDFSKAGNLGRLSIEDVQALFGSAAAERLLVSRMTADDGTAATEGSLQSIRHNLVDQLLSEGFIVTPEIYTAIMDGDYYAISKAVIASGKVNALDAVTFAQQYEERWAAKRERQIKRGAQAFHEDDTRDKLAGAAAVTCAAALIAKTAIAVKKIIKG